MNRWTAALALMLFLATHQAPEVRAKPEDRVTARTFFRAGQKLFDLGRYHQAIEAFGQAYDYWNHHTTLFNIAFCYARLGDTLKAGTYLDRFLAKASEKERQLPRELETVRQATGVIVIRSPKPDLEVYLNGRRLGHKDVRQVVLTGRHVLELRQGDRVLLRRTVTVKGADTETWAPEIPGGTSMPLSPEPRHGQTAPAGPDPRTTPPPREGDTPSKEGRRRIHWAWFVATTTLAAALSGAAVGLGLHAKTLVDDYRRDNALGLASEAQRSRALGTMVGTNALWGAASLSALSAGILAVFTRWRPAERRGGQPHLSPTTGPGSVGLGLILRY